MKLQASIKAVVAAIMFGAASQAMATVVTLSPSNLPLNGYLTTGTYTGSFDGSGSLPNDYTVNSLKVGFLFTDDSNDPFSNVNGIITSSSTLTSTTGNNRSATYTTTYLVPVTSTGEHESVQLAFGGLTFTGQTNAGSSTVTPGVPLTEPAVKGSDIWVKGSGTSTVQCTADEILHDNSCKKVPYYTVKKTITTTTATDYTGTITFGGDLLTSLFQAKKLDFNLNVTGDLYLTSASLDVDYTATPKPQPHDVPEPGSLALFGIAVAGIAGVSRKRGV